MLVTHGQSTDNLNTSKPAITLVSSGSPGNWQSLIAGIAPVSNNVQVKLPTRLVIAGLHVIDAM